MGTMYGRLLETQASRPKPTRASSLRHSALRSLVISMKFRDRSEVIFAARTDGVAEAPDVHLVQSGLKPSRLSFRRADRAGGRDRQICALRNTSVFCERPGRRRPRDANPRY